MEVAALGNGQSLLWTGEKPSLFSREAAGIAAGTWFAGQGLFKQATAQGQVFLFYYNRLFGRVLVSGTVCNFTCKLTVPTGMPIPHG